MSSSVLLLFFAATAASATVVANGEKFDLFGQGPFKTYCQNDNSCKADQICQAGVCTFICETKRDCDLGDKCQKMSDRDFKVCQKDAEWQRQNQLRKVIRDCMEFNTDYPTMPLATNGAAYGVLTAEECATRCAHFYGCKVWTWVGGRFRASGNVRYEPFSCLMRTPNYSSLTHKPTKQDQVISGKRTCIR